MTKSPNLALRSWVRGVSEHTQPDSVHWWTGTDEERAQVATALASALRAEHAEPDLERSPVIVSTHRRVDAGPTNTWLSRDDAHTRVWPLFQAVMRQRTMYVVPYLLGPPRSAFCRVGVEITDSPRIVASIDAIARTGRAALDELAGSLDFARCLHSLAQQKLRERLILHFPELVETWSIGSGSLPNALLCSGTEGLRLASARARDEGWLAEHMSICRLTDREGKTFHLAVAAADSASMGEIESIPVGTSGWQVRKLGGEASWMRPAEDGRLRAVCPDVRSWESKSGVAIDAIVFCGRQASSTPIVYEARSWRHGVYIGATLMREVEGASWATHNPMSMLASCGYNMGDYFAHWLSVGRKLHYPPKIFHVNWFRSDADGQRLWPGGSDNLRVLKWIAERTQGKARARANPLGLTPDVDALDREGLDVSPDRLEQLLTGSQGALLRQADSAHKFLSKFGDCLPAPLLAEHRHLVRALRQSLH